jgi:hypothetical protein
MTKESVYRAAGMSYRRQIVGATATVSTLLTVVGQP